jgi:putative endonuclease
MKLGGKRRRKLEKTGKSGGSSASERSPVFHSGAQRRIQGSRTRNSGMLQAHFGIVLSGLRSRTGLLILVPRSGVRDVTMLKLLKSLWAPAVDPDSDAGSYGEQLAADWLQQERGLRIVTRNWRSPKDQRDEIDLVCDDDGVLVFVEVKARAANALVPGYHAIDKRKKRALRRAIGVYLRQLRVKPRTFRFDVVEVSLGRGITILHFENVPLFSKYFRV